MIELVYWLISKFIINFNYWKDNNDHDKGQVKIKNKTIYWVSKKGHLGKAQKAIQITFKEKLREIESHY